MQPTSHNIGSTWRTKIIKYTLMHIDCNFQLPVGDVRVDNGIPPTTRTWFWVKLTPSIHPYAVSPDLMNLWLDSMFISPLKLSWEIRLCTTATQLVIELSRKVQVTQTPLLLGVNLRPKTILWPAFGWKFLLFKKVPVPLNIPMLN